MPTVDYTGYPAMQPCNGGVGVLSSFWDNGDFSVAPVPNAYCLCSKGTGTTVADLVTGGIPADLTINKPGTGTTWSQSGKGYQVNSVKDATNYINLSSSSVNWMPGNNTGFTAILIFKVAASYSAGQGFFEKVSEAAGVKTRTVGYGVFVSGTDMFAWVDDVSKNVTVPLADLPTADHYCMMTLRYDGTKLYLRVTSDIGTSENNATVTPTTLNSTTNLSSLVVGGATDIYTAGVAQNTPGLAAMGGAVVSFGLWNQYLNDDGIALLEASPFAAVTWPRGAVFTGEDPQTILVSSGAGAITRTMYSIYIHEDYDKTQHWTVFDTPGTPQADYTAQEWLDSTLGVSYSGSYPPSQSLNYVIRTQTNGGPTWPEAMDAEDFPCAVIAVLSDLNGGFLGGGSTPNQSVSVRRHISLINYLNEVFTNPTATDNRELMAWTGWSIGAICNNWVLQYSQYFRKCISMHSTFLSPATANFALNTLGDNRYDYTTPPVFARGDTHPTNEVQNGTAPSTPLAGEANGKTVDWANNADAKTILMLFITGLAAADGDWATIEDDLLIMRAAGYTNLRHKHYTSGRDSLHSKGRDLIVRFLKSGFNAFAPFYGEGQADPSLYTTLGWGGDPPMHPNPYF